MDLLDFKELYVEFCKENNLTLPSEDEIKRHYGALQACRQFRVLQIKELEERDEESHQNALREALGDHGQG